MSKKKNYVFINFLLNGTTLTEFRFPIYKKKQIVFGNSKFRSYFIPGYPLPTGLKFLYFENKTPTIESINNLSGFIFAKNKLYDLSEEENQNNIFKLGPGDTANLIYEELRILIKIAPFTPQEAVKSTSKYIGNPFTIIFSNPEKL